MESGSIEQQIASLEQQLQEKKAALEQGQSSGMESVPSDKEMLHEIVKERIQEHAPNYVPQQQTQQTTPTDNNQPSYLSEDLKDKVQDLINLVFTKSLNEAIKTAAGTNNAALIDAFHDVLVDELYNILLERKKVEAIK